MNIFQTIRQETENFSDKTAVIQGSSKISYGELIYSSDVIASVLKENGIGPFHRVGLLCKDSIDYISASLAILSLSAVVVPISTDHTYDEINEILDKIAVDYLIYEKDSYSEEGAHSLKSEGLYEKEFYIKKRTIKEILNDEYYKINPAFIRFSSGTTDASKGIVLSHESIIERTNAANKGLQITSDDTILWVLPMSFHFVVTILLFLRRAATIVLCSRPFPEALIDGITKHNGTFTYASPFHYNLLANSDLLTAESFRNIRMAVSTAMKLPDGIADEYYSKFGVELIEAYGIIEVGLPFINLSGNKNKRSSVGRALPDYELNIINKDEDGVGEIRMKGKGMLDAYFSPWQNRNNIFTDGWFNTGDLGRMDREGFLTIIGRSKNIINFVGMKIFPYDVESVIDGFPGVKESYVYGEDHPRYGQLPMAKIILEKGFDESLVIEDLRRFCYQKLAQYKVPKDFKFVSKLLRTVSGKIRR